MGALPEAQQSSTEEVKRIAETKEWLENKISELESELVRLRDLLILVDSTLRKTSFIPAIELRAPKPKEGISENDAGIPQLSSKADSETSKDSTETRLLRRSKDAKVLAKAFIEDSKVVIVPEVDVKLSQVTPPFESFFVNRILKGYQVKDQDQTKNKSLPMDQVIQFNVQELEGIISRITILNYRDKMRLNEILSTVTWAFTRMLEKK